MGFVIDWCEDVGLGVVEKGEGVDSRERGF